MRHLTARRTTNNLEKLIKKIHTLTKNKVESGYFKEQGDHPTAEMSYVDLAYMHATGDGNFPERSVFPETLRRMGMSGFTNFSHKALSDYFAGKITAVKLFDKYGWKVSGIAVDLYGVASQYMPLNSKQWADIKGHNSPLVDEGYLMDAFAWRNTYDNFIKEYQS